MRCERRPPHSVDLTALRAPHFPRNVAAVLSSRCKGRIPRRWQQIRLQRTITAHGMTAAAPMMPLVRSPGRRVVHSSPGLVAKLVRAMAFSATFQHHESTAQQALATTSPLDCFTHVEFFEFCCCGNGDDVVPRTGCFDSVVGWTQALCCNHLINYCPPSPVATAGSDLLDKSKSTEDESKLADMLDGSVAAGSAGTLPELFAETPKTAFGTKGATSAHGTTRKRGDLSDSVENESISTRSEEKCSNQVYSLDHCCDPRFKPPSSRCFDTMSAFLACCG
eukprot:TRINITY_DN29286_c0_g1_i1.p1 TRINITY_DN29286_c0_g1~~TRINITY_DN29286_c0_g1_i1.p1  ORF type:complete len:279 (-),score=28.13 TRINITY_DN29286_c0_g1_i1:43-879(-)